jgi:uncharacterized integral membrane protein
MPLLVAALGAGLFAGFITNRQIMNYRRRSRRVR